MAKTDERRVVTKKEFTGENFWPVYDAEEWCKRNGISVGTMQRGSPRGLMVGDFYIGKWRNLRQEDKDKLDGIMTGGRGGPVVIELYVAIAE